MPIPGATLASPFIAAGLQKLFDVSFYRQLYQLFNGKPDYQTEELLKTLQIRLLSVKAALDEAEEEKIMNPNVILWLEKLQAAQDDAEKLWDEIVTKTSGIISDSSSRTLGGKLKQYFKSVKPRLEDIIKRLADVVNMKNVIDLKEWKERRESALSLPTTSSVREWEPVYGRDADKQIITKYMYSKKEAIIVVAIVGMAGVGKTTLSRHFFHVLWTFNLKLWVYVSERCSVLDLTKKIYASVISSNTEIKDTDLNSLQKKLSLELQGKRFLLVLDDCWSDKPDEWNLVMGPFANGARGSVIIVTTQNENVALNLRATFIHTLPLLKIDDCRKIFVHHAFGTNGAAKDETSVEIAKDIVRKCKGLPLFAKVLGSLLRSMNVRSEWDNILCSKIWELPADRSNLLPSLLVGYQHLPLHLKRCFEFCSLFPKGEATKRWKLISLWMAHDLLLQSKTGKTVEKTGDEYLNKLMSWSFLQQSTEDDLDFEMHDLMSELAQYVGGETFYKLEVGNVHDIPKKVRHLSFLQNKIDKPENLRAFHNQSQLRTFLPLPDSSNNASNPLTHGPFQAMLKFLPSLRVLSLSNYTISILPYSIENLKHLRYLNLSKTRIVQVPSVVSLPNLVTLLLSECPLLTELPPNLPMLTNLHHLDVSGTPLEKMPPNFSEMKSLRILTTFFASEDINASRVSELGALGQLCDSLSIVNLDNVCDEIEALEARLKEKKSLKELNLSWAGGATYNAFQLEGLERVLCNLEPHKFLQKLIVQKYVGRVFPEWIGHPSFSDMVSVYLIDCSNCSLLPPLGQLSSLKTLHIERMPMLQSVNPEFYENSQGTPFASLNTLSFIGMGGWAEWPECPRAQFPSLQELHIEGCPSLTGHLNHQMHRMPFLNKLEIFECPGLQLFPVEDGTLQALEYLHLFHSCESLNSFELSSFPKLCDLEIGSCPSLRSLSIPQQLRWHHVSLRNLILDNCMNLDFLPADGWKNSNLNSLIISDCPQVAPLFDRNTGAYRDLHSRFQIRVFPDDIM